MFVGVSLKAYLGHGETVDWCRAAADLDVTDVDMVVFPAATALAAAAAVLAGRTLEIGAQDLAPDDDGAQTGDLPGRLLTELGATWVEVGHAERRARRGETEAVVAAKLRAADRAGLRPLLCIGEPEAGSARAAAEYCMKQIETAIDAGVDATYAYEPVWAIGAPRPAPAGHVGDVIAGIRRMLDGRPASIVYGGAAGPGTLSALDGAVGGIFLGRFAHDPANLAAVLDEARASSFRKVTP